MKMTLRFKGGPGSGDFGHKGRPGQVGGSSSGSGSNSNFESYSDSTVRSKTPRRLNKYEGSETYSGAGDFDDGVPYIASKGKYDFVADAVGITMHNAETGESWFMDYWQFGGIDPNNQSESAREFLEMTIYEISPSKFKKDADDHYGY